MEKRKKYIIFGAIFLAFLVVAIAVYFFILGRWPAGNNCGLKECKEENIISPQKNEPQKLVLLEEKDITPAGVIQAIRPDVVKVKENIYLNYLQFYPFLAFRILKMDFNMNILSSIDAYSGARNPTDARMAADSEGNIWYPFESAFISKKSDGASENFLNLAKYKTDSGFLTLVNSRVDIAKGSYVAPNHPPTGEEVMDDPTPFFANDKYYVITRTYTSKLWVRVFSKDLAQLESPFQLDLSAITDNFAVSVNSIIKINKDIFLIAGIFNGPPFDSNTQTAIVAVPLTDDLKAIKGEKIILSQNSDYETYVDSARYLNGKLYITYSVMPRDVNDEKRTKVIKVFDVNDNYKLLASKKISLGETRDDHAVLELINDKIYFFYYTAEEKLRVKVFGWDF